MGKRMDRVVPSSNNGELIDLTVKVPAGLSDEDLENLGASFGATFADLVREAERSGGLVVVSHPGDPDQCPDCAGDAGTEVWAAGTENCPVCREERDV